MEKSTILAALTFVTLVSGMAVAAHQLWITERAKKEGTGGPMLRNPSGAATPSSKTAQAAKADGVAAPAASQEASGTDQPRTVGRASGDPAI